MGLFDFVEKDYRIGLAAHLFTELPALVVAHIARRRTDETADVELLAVLAHIYPDYVVLRVEKIFGKTLRKGSLSHSRRTDEKEAAHRPEGILDPRAIAANRADDALDGVVLADNPPRKTALHFQQANSLAPGDIAHRNARNLRNDLRDILLLHPRLLAPAKPHHRPRLIHHVQGLVRQAAVRNISLRHPYARPQRILVVAYPVILLIPRAHPLKNRQGLIFACRLHHNFLEPSVQRPVLLHDLAELVQRRRSDALDFSPRKRRLEDVGRVKASRAAARSDNSVELVNEKNHVGILADFVHNPLEPLLEIAPVARSGDDRSDVQRNEPAVLQGRGDFARGDADRDALHDGGFAHSGVSDEHRVVLFPSAENLYDPHNLVLTPHDRVKPVLARRRRKVISELVQKRLFRLFLPLTIFRREKIRKLFARALPLALFFRIGLGILR